MKTPEDEAFDDLARKQGDWGGGYQAKRKMAADKLQEPPSEWASIKAILDEYGLQAIDFVADFKAALAQPAQEPVAHLWECLGKWSAYLVTNGKQADCAPPSWLVEAIQNATAPPKREWIGLTYEEIEELFQSAAGADEETDIRFARLIESKIKEKNT